MLRITALPQPDFTTLKLEGKLFAAWCEELQAACDRAAELNLPVRLDLFDVSFIDRDGAVCLRSLVARGFTISRCSNYIAELLHCAEQI